MFASFFLKDLFILGCGEREQERVGVGERQKERESPPDSVLSKAHSHDPEIMTLAKAKSWLLNQLHQPDTLVCLYKMNI